MSKRIYADEPGPRRARAVRYDWAAWAKLCRAEPGKWIKVSSRVNRHAQSTVARKQSVALIAPDGVFEASVRNIYGKTGELWMRFRLYEDAELGGMEEL